MADEEHPEGTGGGGGQKRGKKGKTRPDEPSPPDPGQGEAASAAIAPAPAAPAEPGPGALPAGDSSAVYAPPPPGGVSTESSAERGISGALALWGPLIIIGFLVLVLNTDDAPQRAAAVAAPVASPPEESEAAAELPPAPPATQTVTPEAPAAPVAEAAEAQRPMPVEEPEVESAAADTSSAAPSSAVVVETTVVEPESTESESTEPVVPALETPQIVAMAANEPAGDGGDSVGSAGELDLDAVLEVARSVIGQAGVEAASQAVASAQAPPPPTASETPAMAMSTESQIVVPGTGGRGRDGSLGCAATGVPGRVSGLVFQSRRQCPGVGAAVAGRGDVGHRGGGAGGGSGRCRLAAASRNGGTHASSPSRSRDGPRIGVLAPASGARALCTALLLVHCPAVAPVPSCASGRLLVRVGSRLCHDRHGSARDISAAPMTPRR